MMNTNAAGTSGSHVGWWKRVFWSLGAATGLFGASFGAGTSTVVAQNVEYRSASAAPASWREFAKQLQVRFAQRLASDDERARKFRDYLTKRVEEGSPPLKPSVRVWVLPDGKLERLEFDGLGDDGVAVNLRALLTRADAGAPPQDMLQPLHLRLSLQ